MKREFKIETLHRMAVFAEVVERGSMSAAARALGVSPSGVSQQMRALEREGGVTLLHRSTRRLTLTEAGARFYAQCAEMVAAARRAQRHLSHAREAPVGELRVAAPVGFARPFALALGPLLASHPSLELFLLEDDAMVDLIQQRIDLALRFGCLADSSWVAQPLAEFEWVLCAAPSYLSGQALPAVPGDLAGLHWLAKPTYRDAGQALELQGPQGQLQRVQLHPRIVSNNLPALHQMALAGLGVTRLLRATVDKDLAAGRLVRVLPSWSTERLPMFAVTPQRETQPAHVRLAIEALKALMRRVPGVRVPRAASVPDARP